jgi:hypothetical protein
MIPLFTPATSRKDVNKTQGDGELAKLANLNRLVENVNTIVANGLPSSGPTLTYTNVGTLDNMPLVFTLVIDPLDIYNTTGTNTIQSYYVPNIDQIDGRYGNNATLTSLIFPDLEISGTLNFIETPSLTTLGFPLLTKILNSGDIKVKGSNGHIININVPFLSFVSGYLEFEYATFNLNSLTYVGSHIIISNYPDTSVSFSLLTEVGSFGIYGNSNLTSLIIGTIGTLKTIYGTTDVTENALNVASVNGILALLVSLDGTNGTTLYENNQVYLQSGTNAAPTGQGLIDKATLEARGCTVTTN